MADRLELGHLQVRVGQRVLVHDVSLTLEAGEVVALVGPSGSGKTLTGRSLVGLVDLRPGVVSASLEVTVDGDTQRPWDGVLGASRRARDRSFASIRGTHVAYLPQGAVGALDPLWTVGHQVSTAARLAGADDDPRPWLRRSGFDGPDVERVASAWPHELSGGMAQRVLLAQTLARGSRFVIADEPTTGLDSPVRTQLLDELRRLADEGLGLLLITHDLRALPGRADRIVVLDAGRVAEALDPAGLWATPPRTEVARRLVDATRRVSVGGLA